MGFLKNKNSAMSKFRKEAIECTDCGTKGIFKRWESVDVDEDPSLREKVMSGEIFYWKCPKCGLVTSDTPGILYHDMKHQFKGGSKN